MNKSSIIFNVPDLLRLRDTGTSPEPKVMKSVKDYPSTVIDMFRYTLLVICILKTIVRNKNISKATTKKHIIYVNGDV